MCTTLFHHFVCICVICLGCFYVVILPPLHLCCVHKPKSIQLISSTIVHLIHCIDHSPPLSYLPYSVILMLHCHPDLLSRYIKKHDFA